MMLIVYIYHPQRSWGKVIFLQASVILSTGRVPGPGGCLVMRGAWSGGGCLVEPPCRMAIAAGSAHPTGMHSFCVTYLTLKCISPNMLELHMYLLSYRNVM